MSDQNRVPRGVPSGGQFAHSARNESPAHLSRPDNRDIHRAVEAADDITAITTRHLDRMTCVEVARMARKRHPQATDVAFDRDQRAHVRDVHGDVIDVYDLQVPLRYGVPDDLGSGESLNIAAACSVDVEMAEQEYREAVVEAALDERWGATVITPSAVRDQIDYETDEDLTDTERDEVVRRWLEKSPMEGMSEDTIREFHYQVGSITERVLEDRVACQGGCGTRIEGWRGYCDACKAGAA